MLGFLKYLWSLFTGAIGYFLIMIFFSTIAIYVIGGFGYILIFMAISDNNISIYTGKILLVINLSVQIIYLYINYKYNQTKL